MGDRAVHERLECGREYLGGELGAEITTALAALHQREHARLRLLVGALGHAAFIEAELNAHDLAEHAAKERTLALDPLAHVLAQLPEKFWCRGRVVRECFVEHVVVDDEHRLGDRFDDRVLGSEVVEDGRAGDPRLVGDLRHGHVCEAVIGEERAGHVENSCPLVFAGLVGRHWTRV